MNKLFVILAVTVTLGLASCVDDNLTDIEKNIPEFEAPNTGDDPGSNCPSPGAC